MKSQISQKTHIEKSFFFFDRGFAESDLFQLVESVKTSMPCNKGSDAYRTGLKLHMTTDEIIEQSKKLIRNKLGKNQKKQFDRGELFNEQQITEFAERVQAELNEEYKDEQKNTENSDNKDNTDEHQQRSHAYQNLLLNDMDMNAAPVPGPLNNNNNTDNNNNNIEFRDSDDDVLDDMKREAKEAEEKKQQRQQSQITQASQSSNMLILFFIYFFISYI